MRARTTRLTAAAVAIFAIGLVAVIGFVRWSYFSQQAHPTARLSKRLGPTLTDRLVMVLVDSVPFWMAFDPKTMPYLASLRPRGTWGRMITEEPTITGQMVYTIATGARPYVQGVVRNWRQNRMPHETFLHGLRRAGLRLQVYGDAPWDQMFGHLFHRQYTLAEDGRSRDKPRVHWRDAVIDLDNRVLVALDRALAREDFDLLIWHIAGTDLIMHRWLRDSPITRVKLAWADLLLEALVAQLDDGHTSFLFFSDHGCAANGRHGYQDPDAREAFYLLMGPRILGGRRADMRQIDISPTVSALFGLTPAAPSAGRPLVDAFDTSEARRARILIAAAKQRRAYLRQREKRLPTGIDLDRSGVVRAEHLLQAQGQPVAAQRAATRALATWYAADLGARRERRVITPLLFWLALALGLGGLLWIGVRLTPAPQANPGHRRRGWIVAGLLVTAVWSLSLAANVYSGRFFNSHFDLWETSARLGTLVLVLAGLALLFGLAWRGRDRLRRGAAAAPVAACAAVVVILGALPGYFQGIYALAGVLAAAALPLLGALYRRVRRGQRGKPQAGGLPIWVLALVTAILVGAFLWELSWSPRFFRARHLIRGAVGAIACGGAFIVALLVLTRALPPRDGEARVPLVPGLAIAAALVIRHLLWPLPPGPAFISHGDHLLAALDVRLFGAGALTLTWAIAHRFGWRGVDAFALGALAVLCAWSTAFEGAAFALGAAAIGPLARSRWFQKPGWAGALTAALLLVGARIVFCQPHEFHFNFTTIHDLFRFSPDMAAALWSWQDLGHPSPAGSWTAHTGLAAPVALRYLLPALVLVPLVLGGRDRAQQTRALLLALLYVGARALHILILARLTVDQLYTNWRGLGELAIMGLWATGLVVAFALFWNWRRPAKIHVRQKEEIARNV